MSYHSMVIITLLCFVSCALTSHTAASGFSKQKLSGIVAESNVRLVAKLGSLVLLERQVGRSMQLIAQVDSRPFYMTQCEEVR